jgi:hypothetical protein
VAEHVDSPEPVDRLSHDTLNVFRTRDVGGRESRLGAEVLLELSAGASAAVLVEIGDENPGPFAGEDFRDPSADSPPGAGDYRDPALHTAVAHVSSIPLLVDFP